MSESRLLTQRRPVRVLTVHGREETVQPQVEPLAKALRKRALAEVIRTGAERDFEFHEVVSTLEALTRALAAWRPDVLQVVGHGNQQGVMSIADMWSTGDTPSYVALTPAKLGEMLRDTGVELAVVTTCHGAAMAQPLAESGAVTAAIGVDLPLGNDGALAFTPALYHALARGKSLDGAVDDGRRRAVGRMGDDAARISLFEASTGVGEAQLYRPPTFYVIGHALDRHADFIERLSTALAPERTLYVRRTAFGEDEMAVMLDGIERAEVIMVLFEGERVEDETLLEQVARAIYEAQTRPVKVFPVYLEGRRASRNVPFGLMRVKPAYLADYSGPKDVEALAADIAQLVRR